MKKYLIYIMLAATALSACKKGVTVAPEDQPEARVAATLASYSSTLTGSTNGWKAFLYPQGGGVYLFSMKFSNTNRVTMLSDLNTASSTTSQESSYKLRQQGGPSLLFDTYNYIHVLADPDPTVNGGSAGSGSNSDIEFTIDNVKGDTVNLVGNRLGSKLVLVKAAAAADYTSFTTGTPDAVNKLNQLRTYFKRMTIGGIDCEVKVDPTNKVLTFTYLDASGNPKVVVGKFYVDGSTNTMVFYTSVVIGTTKVTSIKSLTYDATNHIFAGTINGTAVQLTEAITPLKLDVTASQRWYTQMPLNFNNCWVSSGGFHYGIDDYTAFRSIPGFTNFWFAGASVLGADGIIVFTTGLFAPYVQSRTTISPGIARFTILANQGTVTGSPTAVSMTAARNLIYGGATVGSFADWYLIQTDAAGLAWDMVRVSDAQVWISWKPRA